jgi:hypothetical protein
MNSNELTQFNQAIALSQAGQKSQAYAILSDLAGTYPGDTNILLWMAFSSDNLGESQLLLEQVARLDPQNASLPGAKQWLAEEEKIRPKVATAVATEPSNAKIGESEIPKPSQEPKPKSPLFYNILLGVGAVLVVGAVVLILMNTVFVSDKIAAQGLPVYTNATRLELKDRDKDLVDSLFQLMTSMSFGTLKNVQYEVYKVKKNEANTLLKYYDTELKKMGWTASKNNTLTLSSKDLSYAKDKKYFGVGGSNITDTGGILFRDYDLKADDVLIIAYTAEFDGGSLDSLLK